MSTIMDLLKTVEDLKKKDKKLFYRFFKICETKGKIFLTEDMKPWANKTFGDYSILTEQKIIKTMNKFSYEEAVFNDLRAKRPMKVRLSEEAMKEIGISCEQFCNPEKFTPTENKGRLKGKYCITAANITQFETHHGLIIFNKHNPLESNEKEILDYLETGKKWFEITYKQNKNSIYPFLMWNCLWRAGASINHGHMQVILGEGFHHSEAEFCNNIRKIYKREFKTEYFSDIYKIHELLGLGLTTEKIKIYTSITPKKNKEVIILSRNFNTKYMKVLAKIAVFLIKDMGVESFNMGVILPPLNKDNSWKGFPIITKFIDRGKLGQKNSEIGGVEYISRRPVIEADPYVMFEKLKARFDNTRSRTHHRILY